MAGTRAWLVVLAVVGGWAAAALFESPTTSVAGGGARSCGPERLYGKSFTVRPYGRIGCTEAERFIGDPCRIRTKHKWSCFSFQADSDFIVWFPSKELFARRWSKGVYYERYPCEQAELSPRPFSRRLRAFPTKAQMLADDVVRCEPLNGASRSSVRAQIGRPDRRLEGRSGRGSWGYLLGPERDSFFQVDPEYLWLSFSREGLVRSVGIYQD